MDEERPVWNPQTEEEWQELATAAFNGVVEWRLTHPTATWAEVERAVDERLAAVRARLLQDVAEASAARDLADDAALPACPALRHRADQGGAAAAAPTHGRGANGHAGRAPTPGAPPAGRGFFPLDEELRLLPGALTPTLARAAGAAGRLAAVPPGGADAGRLHPGAGGRGDGAAADGGGGGGLRRLGRSGDAVRRRRTPAEAAGGAGGAASQRGRGDGAAGRGEWAEVKTLAIGTVVPCRRRQGQPGVRAVAVAYFSRLAEAEAFIELATAEVHRRGVEAAGAVAGVGDGAVWQQTVFDGHRPDAVRILDNPHAAEHLTTAAQAVWGGGSAAATAWLAAQAAN